MKEITGELWDYYGRTNYIILITTNGTVKKNGECVMGRGCAAEAVKRIPGIAAKLGTFLRHLGNRIYELEFKKLYSFPVKHNWYEQADLKLIRESAEALKYNAKLNETITFVLPRPGCGNGRLDWKDVRPLLEDLPDNVLVISK